MTRLQRIGEWTPYGLGALLVGGMVHIVSVLAMPALAPRDAYARFASWGPVNQMARAPQNAGDAPPAFHDRALVLSICRFDLTQGPVRFTAAVDGEHFLSVAFQSRTGRIFHSLTDRGALRDRIDVLLLRKEDAAALEDVEEEEASAELRLTSPTATGLIIVRSLAESPQDREGAAARLQRARCAPEPALNAS